MSVEPQVATPPVLPWIRCIACDEAEDITIAPGVGLVFVLCRRCHARSFIQDAGRTEARES